MELVNLKTEQVENTIYCLGDIHEGAANMNENALRKAIRLISASGAMWLGMGDYLDAINHRDPRFNPHEISDKYGIRDLDDLPNKQAERLLSLLSPIADRCIGLLSGNHEDAYKRHNGFDVMSILSKGLNVRNLRQKAFISLQYKDRNTFTICAAHGCGGGGMREGYPINKVYDTFRWDMADFHVQGHIHKLMSDRAVFTKLTHGIIQKMPSFFGVTGCFLSKAEIGTDGYFENKPGKESDIGMLKISIIASARRKDQCKLSLEKIYL